MKERRKDRCPCEAPVHEKDCPCPHCKKRSCNNCRRINYDHFTGQAIARELGWSKRQIERDANGQWLSYTCHDKKDEKTGDVLFVLRWQKRGHFVGYGDHPKIGIDEAK